jgi:hypothetical protein
MRQAGRDILSSREYLKIEKILRNSSEIFNYLTELVWCQIQFSNFPGRILPVHSTVIQY